MTSSPLFRRVPGCSPSSPGCDRIEWSLDASHGSPTSWSRLGGWRDGGKRRHGCGGSSGPPCLSAWPCQCTWVYASSSPPMSESRGRHEPQLLGRPGSRKRPGLLPASLILPVVRMHGPFFSGRRYRVERCNSRYSRERHSPRGRKHRFPCRRPRPCPRASLRCCRGSAHRPRS
jgi:hypothetical protein